MSYTDARIFIHIFIDSHVHPTYPISLDMHTHTHTQQQWPLDTQNEEEKERIDLGANEEYFLFFVPSSLFLI